MPFTSGFDQTSARAVNVKAGLTMQFAQAILTARQTTASTVLAIMGLARAIALSQIQARAARATRTVYLESAQAVRAWEQVKGPLALPISNALQVSSS